MIERGFAAVVQVVRAAEFPVTIMARPGWTAFHHEMVRLGEFGVSGMHGTAQAMPLLGSSSGVRVSRLPPTLTQPKTSPPNSASSNHSANTSSNGSERIPVLDKQTWTWTLS